MTKYIANVIISACVEIEIEARNEEEAEKLALEKANPSLPSDDYWDYEVDCVYRHPDDDEYDDDEEEEDEEEDEENA